MGGGDSLKEEDAQQESSDIDKREMVGRGEVVGFGDDAAAGLVGAAFEDAAEGASVGKRVEFGGLLVQGVALGAMKADGVGVAVSGGVAGGKATGDAGIGVAELGEAGIEWSLAEEFVKAIVSKVVADQEHPLDVVANGGGAVGIGGGGEGDGGLAAVGGAGG